MQYHITASIDPTKSELTAKAVLHLEEAPLTDELTLRINPNLHVTCVRFQGSACGFSQSETGRVVINLPAVAAMFSPS